MIEANDENLKPAFSIQGLLEDGAHRRAKGPRQLPLVLVPAVGFLALVWFLSGSCPSPAELPIPASVWRRPWRAVSCCGWSASPGPAWRTTRHGPGCGRRVYAAAGLALAAAAAGIAWAVLSPGRPAQAAPRGVHAAPCQQPIGVAKGLMPGRVAWVHDPAVTDNWNGTAADASQIWLTTSTRTKRPT